MLTLRNSSERGFADHGWLKSYHSFSFADYYDPKHMHFGPLRVINDDWIEAQNGFDTHGHKDMEIISYVLQGELSHKDSMGNGSTIVPGAVQRMSAGSGVMHSEHNHHGSLSTHLLQIWILPNRRGGVPGYEEKLFAPEQKQGRLCLIASQDGRDGSVSLQQDVLLYAGLFDGAQSAALPIAAGRQVYLHLARGQLQANGQSLQAGDALMLTDETGLELANGQGAEVLVFDLAAQ